MLRVTFNKGFNLDTKAAVDISHRVYLILSVKSCKEQSRSELDIDESVKFAILLLHYIKVLQWLYDFLFVDLLRDQTVVLA